MSGLVYGEGHGTLSGLAERLSSGVRDAISGPDMHHMSSTSTSQRLLFVSGSRDALRRIMDHHLLQAPPLSASQLVRRIHLSSVQTRR